MITEKHKKYFDVACSISKLSNFTREKLGAVVVSKNWDIIGVGYNDRKTHPYQAAIAKRLGLDEKIFLHAEFAALVAAKQRNLYGARVFVYREFRSGELAMSRPCPICMSYIKELGIKDIYYTTDEGYCYERITSI